MRPSQRPSNVPNRDQADSDGDTFGDECDPCPDDATCPVSGGECEGECVELNEELLAVWSVQGAKICEVFTNCICLPPDCDASTNELTEECIDLTNQVTANSPAMTCLFTQFMGKGCDRCLLEPITPLPCEDPCETTTCPEGQSCLPFLGCAAVPAVDQPETGNLCEQITCEAGFVCESSTGTCWNPETCGSSSMT